MRRNALILVLLMISASLAGCVGTDGDADTDADWCDADGCDADGDGVMNNVDLCPITPAGETVNTDGCSQTELDDYVGGLDVYTFSGAKESSANPTTATNEYLVRVQMVQGAELEWVKLGVMISVNGGPPQSCGQNASVAGCSYSMYQGSGDIYEWSTGEGIVISEGTDDICDGTGACIIEVTLTKLGNGSGSDHHISSGITVNVIGEDDDDDDGVMNNLDLCLNTTAGETVDTDGCSQSQLDGDGDGVMNSADLCPLTPAGETVDTDGCPPVANDDDADGVINGTDLCPFTPAGETVDADGCHGGSVVAWGNPSLSDTSNVSSSRVTQIFSTNGAFAALMSDGSVVAWGNPSLGGDSNNVSSDLSSGVTQIFSTNWAFAALKDDGSVVTWGSPWHGGDSSSVSSDLSSGVINIFSTKPPATNTGGPAAFAALKSDGSVVTWGEADWGGDSSSVSSDLSSGVTNIFSNAGAFAALKSDASVVTWGYSDWGGNSSSVSSDLSSGIIEIFSTEFAFAALKSDGSVVTWGPSDNGGNSSSVSSNLSSGVSDIFSNAGAFAALKDDGSVITWGSPWHGGNSSIVDAAGSSSVSSNLSSGVIDIFSGPFSRTFAALKSDGSVVTWGDAGYGGDSSSVSSDLSSGVIEVFFNRFSLVALKDDGSVFTGGSVSSELSSGVIGIFSTEGAFAALKDDGSVVIWGGGYGADSSSVSSDLSSGVIQICSAWQGGFAVIVE